MIRASIVPTKVTNLFPHSRAKLTHVSVLDSESDDDDNITVTVPPAHQQVRIAHLFS